MYYVMLRLFQEGLFHRLGQEGASVSLRGWDIKNREVAVPSELSSKTISVSDLAAGYCPTSRDLYLSKIKGVQPPEVWDRYTGKVIHQLYKEIGARTQIYVLKNRKSLEEIDLLTHMRKSKAAIIGELTEDLNVVSKRVSDKPSGDGIKKFIGTLARIIDFEGEMASAFCDYIIASKGDVEIGSEFSDLLPIHVQELSLNAPPLGLSRGVKPDLIVGEKLIGDIKTGPSFEFHRLTVAAYALAYEYVKNSPIDFGVIFRPQISTSKRVPLYTNTEFFVISDKYRRAALQTRNKKLQLLIEKKDPGDAENSVDCSLCPYHPGCRGIPKDA